MSDAFEATPTPTMPHYGIWKGPNGLRAGWRLLIFFAILAPLYYLATRSVDPLLRGLHVDMSIPPGVLQTLGVFLPPLLIASWIMAKIEGRTFADYGLPWRRAFRLPFWQGAGFRFVSFTVLLLVMRLAGVFSFGPIGLHGFNVWRYAVAWAVLLFLGALLEDFLYRGYLLFLARREGLAVDEFANGAIAHGLAKLMLQRATALAMTLLEFSLLGRQLRRRLLRNPDVF